MFSKYRLSTDNTKIMLIHLLLNGFDIRNIEWLEDIEDNRQYGIKIKKVFGITKDFVDVKKIEQEIESIQIPLICSPLSYEYYSDAPTIYIYEAELPNVPLWINDMNVISKVMMISENRVVSSNPAFPLQDERCRSKGFMYFYDYALKDECVIGKWHLTYRDKVFSIYYNSEYKNISEELLLYSVEGSDKMSSYKMAIYVITRASLTIDRWFPDNFNQQTYEKVGVNDE